MQIDPLSDILSLLRPRSYISSGLEAGGDWSLQFDPQEGLIKCYAVTRGECLLLVDGCDAPTHLEEGDCFVLPSGRRFWMGNNREVAAVAARDLLPAVRDGGMVRINRGDRFQIVGSRFAVGGTHAADMLGVLPPIVHVSRAAEQAVLRSSVEMMMQEMRNSRPGGHLVSQHLAHIMLVQALRHYLDSTSATGPGWFGALADPHLSRVMAALHNDTARRWSLQDLAAEAGMSRSAFASHFKERVGSTPIEYLTRLRMLHAIDRLEHSDDTVSVIALDLGYESESAFSTAFKRLHGVSPRQFGRLATAAAAE
ncbi:AraC family transcriptional regulator [Paroceanicella profunda]|uniref:AraC family transcriptional regulator n=1 Tax=Paroceanicella profunda TaxID=2579971 RepID=UPI00197EA9F5|nr:AraC family transcriptional regulator [Paroceanicella profunda]